MISQGFFFRALRTQTEALAEHCLRGPAQAQALELRAAAEELLVHAREVRAPAAVEELQLVAPVGRDSGSTVMRELLLVF